MPSIYYDPCAHYDGDPGWMLRKTDPDEPSDLNLDAEDQESAIRETAVILGCDSTAITVE